MKWGYTLSWPALSACGRPRVGCIGREVAQIPQQTLRDIMLTFQSRRDESFDRSEQYVFKINLIIVTRFLYCFFMYFKVILIKMRRNNTAFWE